MEKKLPADLFLAFKQDMSDKWQKRNETYLNKLKMTKLSKSKESGSDIVKQTEVVNLMTKASKQDGEEEDEDEDDGKSSKMEDVRTSNFAYAQTKVGEALTLLFALIGIYSAVVSSEMGATSEQRDANKDDIIIVLSIVLASNFVCIVSIVISYMLFIRWKRTKNYFISTDNLFNTGVYKEMLKEIAMVLISPYPFFYGITYKENHMYNDAS